MSGYGSIQRIFRWSQKHASLRLIGMLLVAAAAVGDLRTAGPTLTPAYTAAALGGRQGFATGECRALATTWLAREVKAREAVPRAKLRLWRFAARSERRLACRAVIRAASASELASVVGPSGADGRLCHVVSP